MKSIGMGHVNYLKNDLEEDHHVRHLEKCLKKDHVKGLEKDKKTTNYFIQLCLS